MAGHSKWAQIKRQKETADEKRGQLFSKIARMITLAARAGNPNPETNSSLKAVVEKAKSINVPKDTIHRAIAKASTREAGLLEKFVYEVYGPEGSAFLIEGITDNKNRSTQEIKRIITDHDGKLGRPGSVQWMFEKTIPKTILNISDPAKQSIQTLIEKLEARDDVQNVYTNVVF